MILEKGETEMADFEETKEDVDELIENTLSKISKETKVRLSEFLKGVAFVESFREESKIQNE